VPDQRPAVVRTYEQTSKQINKQRKAQQTKQTKHTHPQNHPPRLFSSFVCSLVDGGLLIVVVIYILSCMSTMTRFLLISSLLACCCATASVAAVETATKSWTIYHSWNGGQDFSRRGVVEWAATGTADTAAGGGDVLTVENDEECLSSASIDAMLEYGWYQLKLQDDNNSQDYVLATVSACNVRRANFRDDFSFVVSRDDTIISMAYTPLVSPLARPDCTELETPPGEIKFDSKVSVELDTPGMALKAVLPNTKPPPGLTFVQHPNKNKGSAGGAAGGQGPSEPEPVTGPSSFIKRYWYVLLPLFLANFIGNNAAPASSDQQQGQEGEAIGGQQGDAAPVAGGGNVSSPSKKTRRGKRG
jgi:hypothetical protein